MGRGWDSDDELARTRAQLRRAQAALLILAPIAMPELVARARARLTANPPRSEGFDEAAAHFAAALRLRQSINELVS